MKAEIVYELKSEYDPVSEKSKLALVRMVIGYIPYRDASKGTYSSVTDTKVVCWFEGAEATNFVEFLRAGGKVDLASSLKGS